MTSADDQALMRAAQGGDEEALNALLAHHQRHIYRFGMKMCRDPEDARDVLQETLIAAARTLRGFRGASSLSTWLYAIARNFCIKKRRRSAFAPEIVSLEAAGSEVQSVQAFDRDPERRLADSEIAQALDSAIFDLEPEYREILVLRDVEGLSAAEVAEITSLTVAATKSRLHRARAAVRARLAPLLVRGAMPPAAGSGHCPEVVDILSRHLEGEIPQDACAEMERHVSACERCRADCDSLKRVLRLCGSLPLPEVPEPLRTSIDRRVSGALASAATEPSG